MATTIHKIEVEGVSDETLRLLDERIRERGGDLSSYIRDILDKDLHCPTLDELLAPLRQQVAESGISGEDLDTLFEEARDEIYAERAEQPG